MRLTGVMTVVTVTMLFAMMGCVRAGGIDRANGDFWTYDMSTTVTVMGLELNVSGSVSYVYKGQSMVSVGEKALPANDISVEGSLEGPVLMLGRNLGSAEVLMTGTQYELRGSIGVLKENITYTTDVTVHAGLVSFAYNTETQTIVTTDPPLLAGFDPEGTHLGDTWTQEVILNSTVISWNNGSVVNSTTEDADLTYSASVASSIESVSTSAGIFSAMRITASDGNGNTDIFWWASEVDNFVKHEVYLNYSTAPTLTLELSDYGTKGTAFPTAFVVLGGAVFLIAVAVLAMVLLRSRRPKRPVASPMATPVPGEHGPVDPRSGN
jgi:hypothetical protein